MAEHPAAPLVSQLPEGRHSPQTGEAMLGLAGVL